MLQLFLRWVKKMVRALGRKDRQRNQARVRAARLKYRTDASRATRRAEREKTQRAALTVKTAEKARAARSAIKKNARKGKKAEIAAWEQLIFDFTRFQSDLELASVVVAKPEANKAKPKANKAKAKKVKPASPATTPTTPSAEETMLLPSLDKAVQKIIEIAPTAAITVSRQGKIIRVIGMNMQKYDMRYEVRELDELITSDMPQFPNELQPRDRDRAASMLQIDRIAQSLDDEELLNQSYWIDRGAQVIGEDGVVESGNGRTMALRRAREQHPESWSRYQSALSKRASEYGISVEGMNSPVLVRVRLTEVDRVAFTREANKKATLGMSEVETAKSEASYITLEMLNDLQIGETQSLAEAFRSTRNKAFVGAFVKQMDANEQAEIAGAQGELSQRAIRRIESALFTSIFRSDRLVARMYEATDNDIKNVTSGLAQAMGKLGRAEMMVRGGVRAGDLSIADDLAIAAEKYAALKERGLGIQEYLSQSQMFERELTTVQERILVEIEKRKRSGKKIREWVERWADLVEKSPDPAQGLMFGGVAETREEMVERWLNAVDEPEPTFF